MCIYYMDTHSGEELKQLLLEYFKNCTELVRSFKSRSQRSS